MACKRRVRCGTAALSCCLFVIMAIAPVQAQQPSPAQTDAIRQSCRSDFRANCSGVQPGGKEALDCLKQNVAKLSPPCRTAVSAIMPAAPPSPPPAAVAVPKPPAPPAAPAAPAAEMPAPARPPASAEMPMQAQAPTHFHTDAIRQSCRADFAANCAGVTPGGKEALQCLKSHVARLSPACKAAVAAIEPAPSGAGHPPKKAPAAVAAPMPVEPPPAIAAPMPRPPTPPPAAASPVDLAVLLRACKFDLIRHCAGVQPGEGRELACLAAHDEGLTIRCRMALKITAPLR